MKNEVLSTVIRKTQNSTVADYQVLANALKCCAWISDRVLGKALHSSVIKLGHHSCQFVIKSLLNMYAKCKDLDECQKLFSRIKYSDTVTWNIVLSGFAGSRMHEKEMTTLFNSMQRADYIKPSSVTLAIVIPVLTRSGALGAGKSVHCYAVKHGLDCETLVGNAFISMYAKSGNISDAAATFRGISNKDVVSWNAMIAGFIENKLTDRAFELFRLMLKGSILPNYATIANILPICPSLGGIDGYQLGRQMHCYVLRRAELLSEVTVINALLSCYLRAGNFEGAETLFRNMMSKDLVSWNSIIAGYAANGEWSKTLDFFREFTKEEMNGPDSVTLISILPECSRLNDVLIGKQIHGYVIRQSSLHQDISVINALISFYAKCGNIEEARRIFSLTSNKDLISWNTMLDALAENQLHQEFINLLKGMFLEGIKADSITLLAVVRYFGNIYRMDKVKEAHGFSVRSGILKSYTEPTLANALLDAYAKCCNLNYANRIFENLSESKNVITCNAMISGFVNYGLHEDAHGIFKRMTEKDLTTWNLMVKAYADNDCPDQAVSLFTELQYHKMRPDAMSILSLLPVCAQMASSNLLKQCHAYVIRAFLDDVYLIGALIDVYSKCATLGYAYKLFQSSPVKDLVMFTAMVGGYAMHGMGEEALGIFYNMLELDFKPDHVIITTVLSACSHAGLVDEGLKIFDSMEKTHQIKPIMEHYACVVDLLARGGRIKDAFSFVTNMPFQADADIWGTLLGACKIHQEVDMGRAAADRLFQVNANDIGNYVIISNMYAENARWDGVLEIRRSMKMRDLKKPVGCSWIEVERKKSVFAAGDYSHPQRRTIYETLRILDEQIKELYEYEL
ncbi:putative pentatricopeptide repeat-containing protein At5g08490 [Lycium barbarum]|uniref:putative pentatricopeptide repeat-containing protein At5g08490 n=1 Tax=Lycium barbarum TaxID=112863 RepID=UPI00293EC49A|nr:putative pentatricopeptide repeat-containing protein At5g08490 [Lycium barbarum]XP_060203684.1 putative pentatricopeptide repeat-containing protein At5g08490 [Lycium barbarum]XP_060203692.1 putative pentatricopeptide repeat-containing protein At5g08490 [Lycium barbarum]XP_060203695.1 putative pentatricopeptide repeat-containing protein At5g08490 [Lycium barbarum]XP_060203701.1 putative pentatricopeptide repeat-containing protein At5g08490 [Lycium barbarum]XP_060203711.1 putative pentatricop